MRFIKNIQLSLLFLLFSFQEGYSNTIINPQTRRLVAVDSIVDNVMRMSDIYVNIVNEYQARVYIKGKIKIKRKNFILKYVPAMFRLQRGVREYFIESSSDVHYTAPNIYDQKVKAYSGTIRNHHGIPGMVEYFNVNIYALSLLRDDRLLSPLNRKARKYYKYQIEDVLGDREYPEYKVHFMPKSHSNHLVGGYFIVSSLGWSVREIRFSGRWDLLSFRCFLKMGKLGDNDEFLPVSYTVDGWYNFLGNKLVGNYFTQINYDSIKYNKNNRGKRRVNKYDLTQSFTLSCDTNVICYDPVKFTKLRPIPLDEEEKNIYRENEKLKLLKCQHYSTNLSALESISDFFIYNNNVNLSCLGNIQCSPLFNPLLLSYGGANGFSYRQDFKYSRLLGGDRLLSIDPKISYNFTHKEFYWSVQSDFNYWPQKQGNISFNFKNNNRIYSSEVLDLLKSIPDSIFDFNKIHLNYFKDLSFSVEHSIEIFNGFELGVGFTYHCRKAAESFHFQRIPLFPIPTINILDKIKNKYVSFAPQLKLRWTPGQFYYYRGKQKINYRSYYPTFTLDYERGMKHVFNSTGRYERIEFDMQHTIRLALMKHIYYRAGFGVFTNQEELYFVDFENFSRHNFPVGWNDELGGEFVLLDSRWYNSSRQYARAHFTYEAPFIVLRNFTKYTRYVQNERLYFSALVMSHLKPYLEFGYGIATYLFDAGVFVSNKNGKFSDVGCKFTFELFNE